MVGILPRTADPEMRRRLEDAPIVAILGARQCGKTTLTRPAPATVALHGAAWSRIARAGRRGLVAILLGGVCLASVATPQDASRIGKNHEWVKRSFRPVVARANASTVRVYCDDRADDVALGTIVTSRGHVLTLADGLSGRIVCQLPDGRRLDAKRVAQIDRHGLVLLRVAARETWPVEWRPGGGPPIGSLLATAGRGPDPVAVGVVTGSSGHGPERVEHDSILRPNDCGGPLVDLSGRAVGINARGADRGGRYAIAARAIRAALERLADGDDALLQPPDPPRSGERLPTERDVAPLKHLEDRIRAAAEKAIASTVGVRIGPVLGSGVLVSADGFVLTAAHVSRRAGVAADILLPDGRVVAGTCLGANHETDAGLIRIDPPGPWPHTDQVRRPAPEAGQWCVATGYPRGWRPGQPAAVRLGRILTSATDLLVTDSILAPGDSGGPLFDLDGNLLGIHSQIGRGLASNLHVPIGRYRRDWSRLTRGDVWGREPTPGKQQPAGP